MKRSIFVVVLVLFSLSLSCKKNGSTGPEPDPGPIGLIDSPVPYIIISTSGVDIPDEPKINATMRVIIENIQVLVAILGLKLEVPHRDDYSISIYGFETWDSNGDDIDVTINGLPEEEDWILYGPYSDKTFFRNKLAFDLAREIGEYSSRGFFAELEVNDEYQGVYILMEKIKRDNNRLDLANLRPEENEGRPNWWLYPKN